MENIDIIFFGVKYIQLFVMLYGITISKASTSELHYVKSLCKALSNGYSNVFKIESGEDKYYIVAAVFHVYENTLEFYDTSLGFDEHGRESLITRS